MVPDRPDHAPDTSVRPYDRGFRMTPELSHGLIEVCGALRFIRVYFDISWDEVAKYVVATPQSIWIMADLLNRYPDPFLFGTGEVAPTDQAAYMKVYRQ